MRLMRNPNAAAWPFYGGLIMLGLLGGGCALKAGPVQLYEGPSLPREQIGIVRSACQTGPGLTIMIVRIDGKDVNL